MGKTIVKRWQNTYFHALACPPPNKSLKSFASLTGPSLILGPLVQTLGAMRIILLFTLILASNQSIANVLDKVKYRLTSECVLSAETQKSEIGPYWEIFIELQSEEAEKLQIFSENNIHKLLNVVDGNGSSLIEARIMEKLSSIFVVTADSENQAIKIRETLLNVPGKCGYENIND